MISNEGYSEERLSFHRQYVGEQPHYRRGSSWFTVDESVPIDHIEAGEVEEVTDLTGTDLNTILEGGSRRAASGSFALLVNLGEAHTQFTFSHPEDITEVLASSGVTTPASLKGRKVNIYYKGVVTASGIQILPEKPLGDRDWIREHAWYPSGPPIRDLNPGQY